MEDKITLGKFIQSKRKELGLSQKDLAKELYVTESAVSKWERGVSYPDITMISGICRVLGISEHELCTASEDNQQREAEFMARSYKSFVRGYTIITGIGYLAAIIPSFIYNVAHGGRFCDGLACASLRRRVHLFSRGLVCYGGAWNAPWGGYRIFAFCAEK